MNLFAEAIAQEGAKVAQQSPIQGLVPIVLLFLIFYFVLLRPQKKRLQEEQSMLSALGKGDEVYTKAGLLGTIEGLTEKIVTLKVDENVKVKVLRSQIGGLAQKIFEKKEVKK